MFADSQSNSLFNLFKLKVYVYRYSTNQFHNDFAFVNGRKKNNTKRERERERDQVALKVLTFEDILVVLSETKW